MKFFRQLTASTLNRQPIKFTKKKKLNVTAQIRRNNRCIITIILSCHITLIHTSTLAHAVNCQHTIRQQQQQQRTKVKKNRYD